jgi:uncharacterized protein YlxW (UPF0749 family)
VPERDAPEGRPHIWIAVVLALLGFLIVLAATTARAERKAAEPRRGRLVDLIQSRRHAVDELDSGVRKLRRQLGTAQARASRTRGPEDVTRSISRLGPAAGTVAMRGPGLEVHLSDSIRQPSDPDEASAFRIHDVDIQLIANALFAAGAEAVSINGNRLVATSPIRAAGETIVVNFRPLSPPYDVKAIGANEDRFQASDIARRFRRWRDLFGLGFRVQPAPRVEVPAFTGRVDIVTAQPVPSAPGGQP